MLDYFKIKNFKSIVEETIDFRFNENKPVGYCEDEDEKLLYLKNNLKSKKNRYVPLSIFWGANASGKTNVIKAFNTFKTVVLTNIIEDPKLNIIKYNPNKLFEELKTTVFELKVNIENKDFIYFIEYNKEEIIKEELVYEDAIVFSIENNKNKEANFKNISGKENSLFNEKNLIEFFEKSCLKDGKQIVAFLSRAIKEYPSLNIHMEKFLKFLSTKLAIFSNNNFPSGLAINSLSKNDSDEELQSSFNRISEVLRELDISIEKMNFKRDKKIIEENEQVNLNEYCEYDCIGIKQKLLELDNITTYHKNLSNKLIPFKFKEDESEGTKILFGLIGIVLKTLDDGCVLLIDELERSLHPLILIQIVKMFKSKYWNKNNSQLIFTTHNTDILDDDILRTTEINIVKKTTKDGTKIYRLSNYKDEDGNKIRNVANFRKQYLSGVYSGIPFPTL